MEDEFDKTPEDNELLEKLKGHQYLHKDITIAIFENETTFPHSVSFLMKIPLHNMEAGVIVTMNPQRGTYLQTACKNRRILDARYRISKGKILSRKGLFLGFEGGILNDDKYS